MQEHGCEIEQGGEPNRAILQSVNGGIAGVIVTIAEYYVCNVALYVFDDFLFRCGRFFRRLFALHVLINLSTVSSLLIAGNKIK